MAQGGMEYRERGSCNGPHQVIRRPCADLSLILSDAGRVMEGPEGSEKNRRGDEWNLI